MSLLYPLPPDATRKNLTVENPGPDAGGPGNFLDGNSRGDYSFLENAQRNYV